MEFGEVLVELSGAFDITKESHWVRALHEVSVCRHGSTVAEPRVWCNLDLVSLLIRSFGTM